MKQNFGGQVNQAVALAITNIEVAFYKCRFSGFQDTLYVPVGSQFFHNRIIEGMIDFIFDKATAMFKNFLILVKQLKPSQFNVLTANDNSVMANDKNENHRGIVIHKSLIGAMPTDKFWLENLVNSNYLGQPWSDTAVIMIIDRYLGAGSRLSKGVK